LAKKDGFWPHPEPIFRTCALLTGVEDHNNNNIEENTLSDEEDSVPAVLRREESDSDEELEEEKRNILGEEDYQSIGSQDPTPDGDPTSIPEPLRRSERVNMQMTTLKPTFHGQAHVIPHVNPTNTLEHESNEAPVLAKTFQKAFAQTYNLKQGTKKFGEKGKEAVVTEMKQLYD